MLRNDIDNGLMLAWMGLAPLKPLEFVLIRIARLRA